MRESESSCDSKPLFWRFRNLEKNKRIYISLIFFFQTLAAKDESSSTDGQFDATQAEDDQGQHSSSSNLTMQEGLTPTSNRTAFKRRSSNPPELQKAREQSKTH